MELLLNPPVSSAVGKPTEKLLSTLSVELAEAKPFELRDYQKDCIAQVLHMWRIGRRAPLLYAPRFFPDIMDNPRLGYLSAPREKHVVKGCP